MSARITVLTGGSTPERDVALAGGGQVVRALRERGYRVTVVDTVDGPLDEAGERRLAMPVGKAPPTTIELEGFKRRERWSALVEDPALRDADLVFPVLHGRQGEGGAVQAILELADIPFAGSDQLGSAVAMDKDMAKRLFRLAEVPTAAWVMWPTSDQAVAALGLPLVVKPSRVGSTVGLTVVESPDDLAGAVAEALRYDDQVILERYVNGREFTVGVLEAGALAVGEIIPQHAVFDYECKYTPGMTEEIFPAKIPEATADRLRGLASTVHMALKLRDYSRVDFRVEADGTPYCLEVNTLPGLTSTSLFPQSARAAGIDFGEMCDRICRAGLARAAREQSRQAGE